MEKLKNRVIALVGMPGVGKSTVAKELQKRYGMLRIDTDELIEKMKGKSISKIFAEEGEPKFRALESLVLKNSLAYENVIVSTGGGIVLRDDNREMLKERAFVVYCKAGPELLHERTKNKKSRPLLVGEDPLARIKKLLETREILYREVADLEVDITEKMKIVDVANKIQESLPKF